MYELRTTNLIGLMRSIFKLFTVILLFSCNKNEEPQEPVKQDTLVSAFFGLDNGLPGLLCNQPGIMLDGMPVNFIFPIDSSSYRKLILKLSIALETYILLFVLFWPQQMKTEKIELCFC